MLNVFAQELNRNNFFGLFQDSKIDEERSVVERRAQEQLRQVREEAEVQAGEIWPRA